jgi:hypothetical protein
MFVRVCAALQVVMQLFAAYILKATDGVFFFAQSLSEQDHLPGLCALRSS